MAAQLASVLNKPERQEMHQPFCAEFTQPAERSDGLAAAVLEAAGQMANEERDADRQEPGSMARLLARVSRSQGLSRSEASKRCGANLGERLFRAAKRPAQATRGACPRGRKNVVNDPATKLKVKKVQPLSS